MSHYRLLSRSLIFFLGLVLVACNVVNPKPTIILSSPPHGSQFREGEDVAFQSVASDDKGVTRVELVIDGIVVRTDSAPGPQGQPTFTLVQTWKATQGTHAISVRAYNASSVPSDPAAISITVSPSVALIATPTTLPVTGATSVPATSEPPPTVAAATVSSCTNNAAFVADVTVPDGTVLAQGQTFNKIWRVRNSGSCTWSAGFTLVFVAGEAMTSNTSIAVPNTAPGATADLLVPMTASNTPGVHAGQWRLKSSGGTVFGTTVSVNINVLNPSAPPGQTNPPSSGDCSGTPTIDSFSASPGSISAGGTATLNWGAVNGADSVDIDQGIGGVAAPGSATVSPGSTTTYTMTAHCGSNSATRQTTVTVSGAPSGQPDLYVTEFSLTPSTPVKGASVHVRIGAYNGGNAASGSFKVRWLAGSTFVTPPPCTWTVASLPASGGQILECDAASPYNSVYSNLTTRAQVDYEGSVAESNEGNNNKDTTINVTANQPDLYVSDFSLNPSTPNHNGWVTVNVTVYNGGNASASTPFTVQWYAGSNYGSPACTWTIDSLPAHGGLVKTCSKGPGTWASQYANITTRAKVDTGNTVSESNEGNNTYDKQITVQ